MKKLFTLALLLICVACFAQSFSAQKDLLPSIGGGELSSVKFGGKKLPSWLNSDYAPIFNGVNQYIVASASHLPGGSSARTIMFWVKEHNKVLNVNKFFVSVGSLPTSINYLSVSKNVNDLRLEWQGSGLRVQSLPSDPVINTWYHIALVVPEGSTLGSPTFFLNGIPVTVTPTYGGTASAGTPILTNREVLTSGKGSSNTSVAYGNFQLAELSIWNRALSADEINRYKDKRLKGTESGLVALFHMSDNSQTLVDSVGGKNAIASNSIQWTRRNGFLPPDVRSERYCLSFDGVDDATSAVATIGAFIPVVGDSMSMEIWFCPQTTALENNKSFFSRWTGTNSGNWGMFWEVTTGVLATTLRMNGANVSSRPTYTKKAEWMHILATSGNGYLKTYLNGQLATQTALATTTIALDAIAVSLGMYSGNYAKVKLCEAAVWNVELTPSQAASRPYIKLTGSEAGLAAYWPCNEGTGTKLKNYSPLGTDADMSFLGAPVWVGRDIP